MALFHRDKVEDSDLISFFLKKFSRIPQDFAFGVKDYERGITLHKIGLTVKSCFTCTGTAAYQCIQISSVLFRIQSDTDILRHQFVIDTHSIAQKQNEDSFYAVLTNFYMKRIVKYIHQARQYLRQSAFDRRSNEKCQPHHRNNTDNRKNNRRLFFVISHLRSVPFR